MCQEVGHTFGLGHQDESGAALGTCMDYSSDDGSQHPDSHDYEQLEQIYGHTDSFNSYSPSSATSATLENSDLNNSQNWGRRVFRAKAGLLEVYERVYQDGSKLVTTVTLASHE